MPAATLNLYVEQGATFRKTLTWKTGTPPVPVLLTGYTARMQFRQSAMDKKLPWISISTTPNAQGSITFGAGDGSIHIYINDSATDTLTQSGVYDLELVASNGDVIRLVQGKFTLNPNVTRQ